MQTGKIKKLIRDRGFGFINATDGREIFFHRSNIADGNFDDLNEGQDVEFEVEKGPKGASAIDVRVVQE
jgi:CspA family cold shock protein